jgi:hypothetical protein
MGRRLDGDVLDSASDVAAVMKFAIGSARYSTHILARYDIATEINGDDMLIVHSALLADTIGG